MGIRKINMMTTLNIHTYTEDDNLDFSMIHTTNPDLLNIDLHIPSVNQ
jgi:hypothetical protein